jgi:transcriptional/translational regulatory protein YebC/TACO1
VAVTRNGGNMADPGSVSYLFHRRGVVVVSKQNGKITEDGLLEQVLEAGAEEVNDLGENFEIVSSPTDLPAVRSALQIPLNAEDAKKLFNLIEAIEDCDDVQNVYGNFDVADDILASLNS